jgi:protein-tyrosine kinase
LKRKEAMMESKNRLFDFARARPKVEALALHGAADAPPVKQHSSAQHEFTDTIAFRSPVISVEDEHLSSERILLAGAAGAVSSAYKMLRTQVLRRMDQLGANTLAVLSPTEGAGKTLTAINLAIAIAADTERTALLVDLDLRNPNIHRRFGFTPVMGVEQCLQSRHPAQDAMIKIAGYERLTLLPARSKVENSSELITGQTTAQLVEELRTRYANRIVIFDLPPVLQADDALAFSRYVQCGLMVVNEGCTQREDVRRSMELIRDLKLIGTVLNGAREKVQSYY